jgi:hypothetical protein
LDQLGLEAVVFFFERIPQGFGAVVVGLEGVGFGGTTNKKKAYEEVLHKPNIEKHLKMKC